MVAPGAEAAALAPGGGGPASPGLVVAAGAPGATGVPLLPTGRWSAGAAAAYVCRGFVCDRPVTTVDELSAALSASA